MDIIKTIRSYLFKTTDEPRAYVGSSSIGKPCLRSIWYAYNGAEKTPKEPESLITFEIGKQLESMMLEYLRKSGIHVICQNKFYQDSEVFQFQGHIDGMIVMSDESKAILEVKTAKDSSFNRFKKDGLIKWSQVYYAQLQSYMGMSGVRRGVLLAINKNSSEMHQEWVNFDGAYYDSLKIKARSIILSESEPPKISDNGSYYICKQCEFRKICHG